ncbi:MAG: DNA polymerase III subunit epsilon [Methylococcales bacterium]|jgi:DNA polymerase III subunit epsilon|nr:DNA polymerase III subunit epsilon [Methylococcales bacterium]MBT7410093.1 DNA polymerase III subunit epsilon [Methylococcales bacterium]
MNRQIVLDTETTGLSHDQGHRIIEIGCVELLDRKLTGNNYHQYIQPDRLIDEEAIEVHGITNEFLKDKPRFSNIVDDFIQYIKGAELVIHNAPFDVGFLNAELNKLDKKYEAVDVSCKITDSLLMARSKYPGQKNNLDALCRRLGIDNSKRELHGALLDAEILAEVYLSMTGGQISLLFEDQDGDNQKSNKAISPIAKISVSGLKVVMANEAEIESHQKIIEIINKKTDGACLWKS